MSPCLSVMRRLTIERSSVWIPARDIYNYMLYKLHHFLNMQTLYERKKVPVNGKFSKIDLILGRVGFIFLFKESLLSLKMHFFLDRSRAVVCKKNLMDCDYPAGHLIVIHLLIVIVIKSSFWPNLNISWALTKK